MENDYREIKSRITASILLYLYERGSMTASELANLIGVDTKTIYAYLYYYNNNKQWLARQSFTWTLTELGKQVVRKYRKQLKRIVNSFRYKESINLYEHTSILSGINLSKDFLRTNQFSKDQNSLVVSLLAKLRDIEKEIVKALTIRRELSGQANICVSSSEELREALIIINTALSRFSEQDFIEALKRLENLGIIRRYRRQREHDHCIKLADSVYSYVQKNLYTSVLL